jgi:hypothetical protein
MSIMNASRALTALALSGIALAGLKASAADHGDTPALIAIPRHDARITDLHVFTNGDNLVLSLSTFPNLPGASYQFPADLALRLYVDNHSEVSFDNATDNARFGGTIVDPGNIGADIVFEFTFNDMGQPNLETMGLTDREEQDIKMFAGLRDDPFIRGPQIGRNVASVVIELPLAHVLPEPTGATKDKVNRKLCDKGLIKNRDCAQPILVWATSDVPDLAGSQDELGGRALRSQCPQPICNALDGADLNVRNQMSPMKHSRLLGMRPDVVIFDTSRPASFPNGRVLTDDVVSIIAPFGQNILGNDFPCPTANDVAFLAAFPYLAPPHTAAPPVQSGPACAS